MRATTGSILAEIGLAALAGLATALEAILSAAAGAPVHVQTQYAMWARRR